MTAIEPGRLLQLRSAILHQNQALQRAAGDSGSPAIDGQPGESFGRTLADAVRAVNDQQAKAGAITESYERGDTSDIVQVMVERQKASLGFEATLQVRNKLLSAYRDIILSGAATSPAAWPESIGQSGRSWSRAQTSRKRKRSIKPANPSQRIRRPGALIGIREAA